MQNYPNKSLKKKKNLSHITSSNHYRYNRLREGGWGIKAPRMEDATDPLYVELAQAVKNQLKGNLNRFMLDNIGKIND